MTTTLINELAHQSAGLLLYWLFCPECVFDIHVRNLGYREINYGQKISCKCPNCNKMITKTIGVNLGIIKNDRPDYRQDEETLSQANRYSA